MYKQCKTEQSAQRQHQFAQGLLEMMQEKAYRSITVSDLCAYLEIPRKTFYRYFPTKDDALYLLVDQVCLEAAAYLSVPQRKASDPVLALMQQFVQLFEFWRQQEQLMKALEGSDLLVLLVQRTVQLSLLDNNFYHHFLPGTLQTHREYLTGFFVTGIFSMVLRWRAGGYRESPQELAQLLLSCMPHLGQGGQ